MSIAGRRLRQQDQVMGTLEAGTGRAISCQRLADLGHGVVVRLQHCTRGTAHDPADRDDHNEAPGGCRAGENDFGQAT